MVKCGDIDNGIKNKEEKRYYWLKLKDDFFEEKHVKALRALPDGNALVVVYLKIALMSLKNEGFIICDRIMPTYEKELSLVLDEDEPIVALTIKSLLQMGAVEKLDNDTLFMTAMQKCIGSESSSAERVRKFRALQCNSDVTELKRQCNTEIRDRDRDKRIEKDIYRETTSLSTKSTANDEKTVKFDYQNIISCFNSICRSLPKVKSLTETRRKSIKAAETHLNGISFEDLFKKVECSDYLTGRNGIWTGCGFDWILKQSNLVKIMEGNYDNKAKQANNKLDYSDTSIYENDKGWDE